MAKVLILSIPEEEESLIDKIMAIINNPHDGQEIRSGKSVSVISIGKHQCTRGYKRYKEMFQICRVEKSDFPLYFYILAGCAD